MYLYIYICIYIYIYIYIYVHVYAYWQVSATDFESWRVHQKFSKVGSMVIMYRTLNRELIVREIIYICICIYIYIYTYTYICIYI